MTRGPILALERVFSKYYSQLTEESLIRFLIWGCFLNKGSLFQGRGGMRSVESSSRSLNPPEGLSTACHPDKLQLALQPVGTGTTGSVCLCYSVNNGNHFPTMPELARPAGFVSVHKQEAVVSFSLERKLFLKKAPPPRTQDQSESCYEKNFTGTGM